MSIWRYANPLEFMRLSGRLLTPLWVAACVLLAVGLGWAVFGTPDDYRQGSTVKIMFIHVPAAMLSINTYAIMAIASAVGIIRRHHVSFLVAKAAAPIALAFTAIALSPGAVWGHPMWGARWGG